MMDNVLNFILRAEAAEPLKTHSSFGNPVSNLPQYVGQILTWLVPVAIFIAVYGILISGFDYMRSGGNPEIVKAAKERIFGILGGVALLILIGFIYRILI
jgi:hypothetical protein